MTSKLLGHRPLTPPTEDARGASDFEAASSYPRSTVMVRAGQNPSVWGSRQDTVVRRATTAVPGRLAFSFVTDSLLLVIAMTEGSSDAAAENIDVP